MLEANTDPAEARVLRLADGVGRMLAMTRALVSSERQVDLSDLRDLVGRLCAQSLDLDPDRGRAVRPRLILLRDELDLLTAAVRAAEPGGADAGSRAGAN